MLIIVWVLFFTGIAVHAISYIIEQDLFGIARECVAYEWNHRRGVLRGALFSGVLLVWALGLATNHPAGGLLHLLLVPAVGILISTIFDAHTLRAEHGSRSASAGSLESRRV